MGAKQDNNSFGGNRHHESTLKVFFIMREIVLTTKRKDSPNYMKYVAIVDDEDYDNVSQYNWSVRFISVNKYPHTTIKGKNVLMHQLIMKSLKYQIVDHKDGDGLNNQRSNLRFCTTTENNRNRKPRGSSKYVGVSITTRKYDCDKFYWLAQIAINGVRKNLGRFKIEEDAARAYDDAAKIYYGEFAKINFNNN